MGKLWIEDERLRLDNGKTAMAIAPSVIAASRVTDIPAHYCDWFFHRLRRGYMAVPMVGSAKKLHKYVSFTNTQFIVFFSKNPAPLIPQLPWLKEKGIDFYINYTLNDYSRLSLEPGLNVEVPLILRIDNFKRLADMAGPERVIWHFDPLVLAPNIKIDTLMERISFIAEELKGYTKRLSFGFLNVPRDSIVHSNLRAREIKVTPWTKSMKALMVQELVKANKSWGYELATCSEADNYSSQGVIMGKCVDYHLIAQLAWHNDFLMDSIGAKIYTYDPQPTLFGDIDPLPQGAIMLDSNHYILEDESFKKYSSAVPTEYECNCDYSFDVGTPGSCTYKCAYCFAAEHSYRLDEKVKAHGRNPKAPALTGQEDDELKVTIDIKAQNKGIQMDRSLKAMNGGNVEFDEACTLSKYDPYYILATKVFGYKKVITLRNIEWVQEEFPDPEAVIKQRWPSEYEEMKKNSTPVPVTAQEEEVIIDPAEEEDEFDLELLEEEETENLSNPKEVAIPSKKSKTKNNSTQKEHKADAQNTQKAKEGNPNSNNSSKFTNPSHSTKTNNSTKISNSSNSSKSINSQPSYPSSKNESKSHTKTDSMNSNKNQSKKNTNIDASEPSVVNFFQNLRASGNHTSEEDLVNAFLGFAEEIELDASGNPKHPKEEPYDPYKAKMERELERITKRAEKRGFKNPYSSYITDYDDVKKDIDEAKTKEKISHTNNSKIHPGARDNSERDAQNSRYNSLSQGVQHPDVIRSISSTSQREEVADYSDKGTNGIERNSTEDYGWDFTADRNSLRNSMKSRKKKDRK